MRLAVLPPLVIDPAQLEVEVGAVGRFPQGPGAYFHHLRQPALTLQAGQLPGPFPAIALRAQRIEVLQVGNQGREQHRDLVTPGDEEHLLQVLPVVFLGDPVPLVQQADLSAGQVEPEALLGGRGRPPALHAVDSLLKVVVDPGSLQVHVEPDPGPVVAEFEKGSGDPVGTDEFVVARVHDHQIRLVLDDFLGEIEQAEGVDRGHAAIDHLEVPARVHVGQHLLEEVRKRSIGGIGKPEQGGGPQGEDPHRVGWFGKGEAGIGRNRAEVLVLKEAVADLLVDRVHHPSLLAGGHEQSVGRTGLQKV